MELNEEDEEPNWEPRRLPVIEQAFYVDVRLRELRAVDEPQVVIPFASEIGKAMMLAWQSIACPRCGQTDLQRWNGSDTLRHCDRCRTTTAAEEWRGLC